MRRLMLAVLAVVLVCGYQATHTALAVNYAPGWNLVAGPEGSYLIGATGSIFTLQPGDAGYESFPADSALHGGFGYWAYFPDGGGITLAAGSPGLKITPVPGQYMMLGNPSQRVASVSGADQVLTYTPAGGYTASTVIPPGQGAWVSSSGQITLTAAADSTPVSAPPVTVSPAAGTAIGAMSTPGASAAPATTTGLKAVALGQGDLPGYTLDSEDAPDQGSSLAVYRAFWFGAASSSHLLVAEILRAEATTRAASAYVTGFTAISVANATTTNVTPLPSSRPSSSFNVDNVGDEERGYSSVWTSTTGVQYDQYQLVFRRGTTTVNLVTEEAIGTGNPGYIVALAHFVDARLNAGSAVPSSTVATPAAVLSTATPSAGSLPAATASSAGRLLSTSGSGNGQSVVLALPAAGATICAQVSGESPGGLYGPSMSVVVYQASGAIESFPIGFDNGGCQPVHLVDGAGNYYLAVIATPWTNWTLTVDAGASAETPLDSAAADEDLIRSLAQVLLTAQ